MIECVIDGQILDFDSSEYTLTAVWETEPNEITSGNRRMLYFTPPAKCFLLSYPATSDGEAGFPFGRRLFPEEACELILEERAAFTDAMRPLWQVAGRKTTSPHLLEDTPKLLTVQELKQRWEILKARIEQFAFELKHSCGQKGPCLELPDDTGLRAHLKLHQSLSGKCEVPARAEALVTICEELDAVFDRFDTIIIQHSQSALFSRLPSELCDETTNVQLETPFECSLQADFDNIFDELNARAQAIGLWLGFQVPALPPLPITANPTYLSENFTQAHHIQWVQLRAHQSEKFSLGEILDLLKDHFGVTKTEADLSMELTTFAKNCFTSVLERVPRTGLDAEKDLQMWLAIELWEAGLNGRQVAEIVNEKWREQYSPKQMRNKIRTFLAKITKLKLRPGEPGPPTKAKTK